MAARNIGRTICMARIMAVQFSSVRDGIFALGKSHMRSTPFLRRFPNVAFETVPMFVWFISLEVNLNERQQRTIVLHNYCPVDD